MNKGFAWGDAGVRRNIIFALQSVGCVLNCLALRFAAEKFFPKAMYYLYLSTLLPFVSEQLRDRL
jgi:hypothetical protein